MTELEKWANCHKEVALIKGFLDFVKHGWDVKLIILEDSGEGSFSVYRLIAENELNKLIKAFFNIDEKKLEESRAMNGR